MEKTVSFCIFLAQKLANFSKLALKLFAFFVTLQR